MDASSSSTPQTSSSSNMANSMPATDVRNGAEPTPSIGTPPAVGLQCSRCKKILRPGEKFRNKSNKLCSSCYVNHYNSASQKAKRKYDQHRKDPNFDPQGAVKERRKRAPVIHLNGKILPTEELHQHHNASATDQHEGFFQQNHHQQVHQQQTQTQQLLQHNHHNQLTPSSAMQMPIPLMPLMPPSYALMSLTNSAPTPRSDPANYRTTASGPLTATYPGTFTQPSPHQLHTVPPIIAAGAGLERFSWVPHPATQLRARLVGGSPAAPAAPMSSTTLPQQQTQQQQQQQQHDNESVQQHHSQPATASSHVSAAPPPAATSHPVVVSGEKVRQFEARVDSLVAALLALFNTWQGHTLQPAEYPRTAELEVLFKRVVGEDWAKFRLQFTSGRRLLDRVTSSESRDQLIYPHAFERVATVELCRGKPLLAIEFLMGALQLLESRQRKVEMLLLLQKLSIAYGMLNCSEEEELFFLLAARLSTIVFSPLTVAAMTVELKGIYHHNNSIRNLRARRFDDADHDHQESIRILEPLLVSKRPPALYLAVRQLKAILSTCKGDYVEATMTSESLLKMTKEIYGGHHVRLAESLHNYGLTMFVTEQWEFSFEYLQEALKLKSDLLGESHPSTLLTLQGLGMLHLKKTQLAQQQLFRLFEPRPILFTVSDVDIDDC